MDKKERKQRSLFRRISKSLNNDNTTFEDILKNLDTVVSGNNYGRDLELEKLNDELNKIAYEEIDKSIDYHDEDASVFVRRTFNKAGTPVPQGMPLDDIFKTSNDELLNLWQEKYKNIYYLYDDIKMIVRQIPELKEAVKATRDAIINSDNTSREIAREIEIKIGDDETKNKIISEIEKMEETLGFNKKIKNIIVPNCLEIGKYYTYICSYSEICRRYDYIQNNYKGSTNYTMEPHLNALESYKFSDMDKEDLTYITESVNVDITDKKNKITVENTIDELNEYLSRYEIYNDSTPVIFTDEGIGVVESLVDELSTNKLYKHALKTLDRTMYSPIPMYNRQDKKNKYIGYDDDSNVNNGGHKIADGTVDYSYVSANSDKNKNKDEFHDIKGVYIKNIHPKYLIPIKIMEDKIIGYYWIKEKEDRKGKPRINQTMTPSFSTNLARTDSKKDIEKELVTKLTDKIIKAFDKKYLEENEKFRELIISALMHDELYKKRVTFQFIPPEYIVEHSIDEDEEGNGTSILIDSLFNAKLFLSLLLFKMLTIITQSNDKRIYNVTQSAENQDVSNNINRVIREIKASQMNFMDLMNYNSLVSKLGAGKSIFLPMGMDGKPVVSFDILAGQEVQLNTELMEMLKTSAITATGVPIVIMEYFQNADFAKSLEMANIKFANNVSSKQLDFNVSLTELYRKTLKNFTDLDDRYINAISIKLTPPKAMNIINSSEQAQNSQSLCDIMVETKYPDASQDETNDLKKALAREILFRHYNPSLPWDELDKAEEYIEMKVKQIQAKQQLSQEEGLAGSENPEGSPEEDNTGEDNNTEDMGMDLNNPEENNGEEPTAPEYGEMDDTTDYTDDKEI